MTAGRLYLRDNDSLYCFSVRKGEVVVAPQTVQHPPLSLPKHQEATTPRPDERSPRSVYVPTPQDVVERMLALAEPQKTDVVIDLGSGDGRIVIAAAKTYDCKAIGYELDMELVESSRLQATKSGVEELVDFVRKDLFEADLANVQVVTLYLLPKQLEILLPKLRQLKPGARIVAHQFPLPGLEGLPLEPDMKVDMQSTEDGDLHTIYLWTTPLKVDARK